ncbi:MAG: hypothetical protein ACPH9F_04310 [Candidatus Poseidoniaceae archaeon]
MQSTLRNMAFLLTLSLISFLPFASAHGDEPSTGLANYQILGIALATALLAFALVSKKFASKMRVFTPVVFSFALFTGVVHVLLGLSDRLLLIGGVGVLGILLFPIVVSMDEKKSKFAQLGLSGVTLAMFVGYFVSNHDIHYVLEDYLGIATKLSEIALLVGIYKSKPINMEEE